MIDLVPLGDRAYLARFATEADARAWASAVEASRLSGLQDMVLAYRSVGVYLDPDDPGFEGMKGRLHGIVATPEQFRAQAGALLRLPVIYDGEDLSEVARKLSLTVEGFISAHSGRVYDVFAVGFLPGFPYCGYLPEALSGLERRAVPRTRVPAGSVAIAGRQTGVYPQESPGGWHLIGRTLVPIADFTARYFPIRAGMQIAFDPVAEDELAARQAEHTTAQSEYQWEAAWDT